MSLADQVLAVNDDLPIRTNKPVHSGKVRSVYWLTEEDSQRLIKEKGYDVAEDAPLAIMVISDRISAFDCIWHGQGGLKGVPGKGAALNALRSDPTSSTDVGALAMGASRSSSTTSWATSRRAARTWAVRTGRRRRLRHSSRRS